MYATRYDQLVSKIYEAAAGDGIWPDVMLAIADLTGAKQAIIHLYDGVKGTGCGGCSPHVDPEYKQLFKTHWSNRPVINWKHLRSRVPGEVVGRCELVDDETFISSPMFHEFFRPQGLGTDALGACVMNEGDIALVLTINSRLGEDGFSDEVRRLFSGIAIHMVRAIRIARRINVGRIAFAFSDFPPSFQDKLLIDRNCHVVDADDHVLERLQKAGLLATQFGRERLRVGGELERMVYRLAVSPHFPSSSSAPVEVPHEADCTVEGGSRLRLMFARYPHQGDMALHRSCVRVGIADTRKYRGELAERLSRRHGLTQAQASVAIEIARGDGRSAAAERLGIRETTVRSHLSAIFDKLDIHRQAELVRLVEDA